MKTGRKMTGRIMEIVPTAVWGGGEQYVYDITAELMKEGKQVCVLCKKSPDAADTTFQRFSSLNPQRIQSVSFRNKFSLPAIRRTAGIIRKEKTELVHTHVFTDAFIVLAARRLYHLDTRVIMTRHLARKARKDFVHRFIYRHLDKMLFVSEYTAKTFFSNGYPKSALRWEINPNTLPAEKIEAGKHPDFDLRERYGIPPDALIAAYTGRIVKEKAVDLIIEAAIALKDENIRFLILGRDDGSPYVQGLRRRLQETGCSNVIFTGFTEKVMQHISQCDFGILPTRVEEALSFSALEFLSLGKPMIVTDKGGHSDLVREGITGYHIHIDDTAALVRCIRKFIQDPAAPGRMKAAALSDMKDLDMNHHIARLLQ